MIAITLFFTLMMLSIGIYTKSSEFRKIAPAVSLPFVVLAWVLFLLIRYPKFDGLIKAGICTTIIGIFGFYADHLINRWLGIRLLLPVFRPFTWRIDTINDNVKWLLLIVCTFAGIILITSGIIKRGRRERRAPIRK